MSDKELFESLKLIHGLAERAVAKKLCIRCMGELDLKDGFYSKGKDRPNDYSTYCKTCTGERNKLKRK